MAPLAVTVALLLLTAGAAGTGPRPYRIVEPPPGTTAIEVAVPYSFGTHRNAASVVQGEVLLDREKLVVEPGQLRVPLAALRSDDPKRDCHLREALGLDYARSRFPAEHVCNDENGLPGSGGDSLAFRDIRLDVTGGRPLEDPTLLEQGREVRLEIAGRWVIHGVTRPALLRLTVSVDPRDPQCCGCAGARSSVFMISAWW
jgi:polyisoprenoid-binding protein YceI